MVAGFLIPTSRLLHEVTTSLYITVNLLRCDG